VDFKIRPATPADRPRVEALLKADGLPLDGIPADLARFVVAESPQGVVGAAGLEVCGPAALLRSVVVAPSGRGSGIGSRLVERVCANAAEAGADDIYLLTTTAPGYFPRFGFTRVDRKDAPAALRSSAEFRGACPDSAILMKRTRS
jgi:N-acetylglutamate synthase-like GNAT family acetyltransferase